MMKNEHVTCRTVDAFHSTDLRQFIGSIDGAIEIAVDISHFLLFAGGTAGGKNQRQCRNAKCPHKHVFRPSLQDASPHPYRPDRRSGHSARVLPTDNHWCVASMLYAGLPI